MIFLLNQTLLIGTAVHDDSIHAHHHYIFQVYCFLSLPVSTILLNYHHVK